MYQESEVFLRVTPPAAIAATVNENMIAKISAIDKIFFIFRTSRQISVSSFVLESRLSVFSLVVNAQRG